jgi:hypothetical protein
MKKAVFGITMMLMVAMTWSCSTKRGERPTQVKKVNVINPNGDSELTLLMREMFTEGERIKYQIEAGEAPSGLKNFKSIHSAIPTTANASGPLFESFANSYLDAVKELEASDRVSFFKFNRMIDQCMNCHTEFCPGPKRKIKKLYIEI